ncbi:ferredoxin reductase [Mycobacterium sp.]|uniref:ferredoxin reductase n=1 Tax=Mycobacterium sp. TaxID=1785 RepID=UPI0025F9B442|nr:ferredoxin reductase [Mycobacterium sp.]MBW0011588.1 ferredoxin reductase [Mycobacterium sp.]
MPTTLNTVARLLTTPLVPQDFIDLVNPLASGTDLRGRIEAIKPETASGTSATLRIRLGRGWGGHRAGQYVRLGIDIDGVRQWRTYSITSSPRQTSHITVTVTAIPGGLVSNYLVREATVGTLVHLDQAAGEFMLPARLPDKLLFVTAGSGITPVMGMLRAHAETLGDVVLVHSARSPDDVVFGQELRALARDGAIRLIEHHTIGRPRLTARELTEVVPDWRRRDAWACGPGGLLDDLENQYTAAGLETKLRTERFRAAAVSTGDGGPVSFTRSGVTAETATGATLLEAGEEAGVLMPSGCRMGVCFGCVVPLRRGVVRDVRNGDLTSANPGDGVLVQTCISAAAGPCQLDI